MPRTTAWSSWMSGSLKLSPRLVQAAPARIATADRPPTLKLHLSHWREYSAPRATTMGTTRLHGACRAGLSFPVVLPAQVVFSPLFLPGFEFLPPLHSLGNLLL